VGTSAGALVGALLAGGRDVTEALGVLAAVGRKLDFGTLTAGSESFLNASRQAALATDPRLALRAIGSAAREARTTLTEDDHLGLLDLLEPWSPTSVTSKHRYECWTPRPPAGRSTSANTRPNAKRRRSGRPGADGWRPTAPARCGAPARVILAQ
jgi:hypothetical protein